MKKAIYAILVTVILLACSVISVLTQTGGGGVKKEIVISEGLSATRITDILRQHGVIKSRHFFKISLILFNQRNQLKAGTYKLSSGMTNWEIILKLYRGEVIPPQVLKVTFPEGTSVYKMGKILVRPDFIVLAGTLEGYLFPDTYFFDSKASNQAIINIMRKRFDQVVIPYWVENNARTKYNLHQILTLASIIEKEAQKAEERAIISSVFHNRLNINMALDSCPTIKYALNDPTPIVYLWQLKVKSPYNTYLNRGLPPGPICNPGLESIKAAIYPAKTKYFYFVAKKDGSHIFSRTWEEHQRARVKAAN